MQVSRRAADPADTAFARDAHHRAFRDVVERQFGPWDEAAQDRFFEASWSATPFEIVLCDGAPCGYVSLVEREDELYVVEIVVVPEFQGRGVGSAVLRQAMAFAAARGVPLRLGTHHLNRAAGLYRRLGFRETGRTETHILLEWRPGTA